MKKILKRLCTGVLALATVVTTLPSTPVHAESKQYLSLIHILQKFIRNVKGSREMEERFMIFEEMLKEERAAGFAKGRAEGVAEGRISESKDTLLLFLQNLGTVPKVLSDQIEEQGDLDVLKEWLRLAFKSKSVEEFAKKIK